MQELHCKTLGVFMEKIILASLLISVFLIAPYLVSAQVPSCSPSTPCCCKTPDTDQRRCYTEGVCCAIGTQNEYWTIGSCYTFSLQVSGPSSYIVGKKTDIVVMINNLGAYADNYDIAYTLFTDNPSLMSLDTTDAITMSVSQNQIKGVFPKLTVFSVNANGMLMVNATSNGDPTQWRAANITITEGSLPLSLPEFSDFMIIILILLSGFAYVTFNTKGRKR